MKRFPLTWRKSYFASWMYTSFTCIAFFIEMVTSVNYKRLLPPININIDLTRVNNGVSQVEFL